MAEVSADTVVDVWCGSSLITLLASLSVALLSVMAVVTSLVSTGRLEDAVFSVVALCSAPVVDEASTGVVGSVASVVEGSLALSVVDASGLSLLGAAVLPLAAAGVLLAAEGLLTAADLARATEADVAESLSDFKARPDFSPELLGAMDDGTFGMWSPIGWKPFSSAMYL